MHRPFWRDNKSGHTTSNHVRGWNSTGILAVIGPLCCGVIHVSGKLFIASADDGSEDHEANSLEQGDGRFREWKGNNQVRTSVLGEFIQRQVGLIQGAANAPR